MESKTLNYTLVGGFVLAMLAALLVTIAILTGRTGSTDTYTTIFDNVAGLQYGTQVMYEGYPVGQIESIAPIQTPSGTMTFKIEMSVIEGWQIPQDSQTLKAASGLLSALSIDIRGGASLTYLSPGDNIPAGTSTDMFASISNAANQFGGATEQGLMPLLMDMRGLVAETEKTMTMINGLIANHGPSLMTQLQTITQTTADQTPMLLENLKTFTETLNSTVAHADTLLTTDIQATTQNARQISEEALDLTRNLKTMDQDIRNLLESIDTTITDNRDDIDQSVNDLRYTLATISRHIGAVSRNLEGTSRHMLEFSRQIRDNPGLLISGTSPRSDPPNQ